MTNENGRSPEGSGSRASHEADKPSSPEASIPSAVDRLRINAEALNNWLKSFDEHVRNDSDPLFGRGYPLEAKINDLFQVTARLAASIVAGLEDTASAIEARRAATGNTDAVEDESATRQGDAQGDPA